MKTIHLGFEIGTGKPIAVPLRNLAITGQTQESRMVCPARGKRATGMD